VNRQQLFILKELSAIEEINSLLKQLWICKVLQIKLQLRQLVLVMMDISIKYRSFIEILILSFGDLLKIEIT
jgi:hypothetical protein